MIFRLLPSSPSSLCRALLVSRAHGSILRARRTTPGQDACCARFFFFPACISGCIVQRCVGQTLLSSNILPSVARSTSGECFGSPLVRSTKGTPDTSGQCFGSLVSSTKGTPDRLKTSSSVFPHRVVGCPLHALCFRRLIVMTQRKSAPQEYQLANTTGVICLEDPPTDSSFIDRLGVSSGFRSTSVVILLTSVVTTFVVVRLRLRTSS